MKHIASISDLASFAVDKPTFWSELEEGQLLFPIGTAAISHAIDAACKSILSHVGTVVKWRGYWCLYEAIYPQGVVLTPLWIYIDGPQDLILCERRDPTGKLIDMTPALDAMIKYLHMDYAALGLVKEGLHLICPELPPEINGNGACYCSGVTQLINEATSLPYPLQQGGAPSPEFLFVQPSTDVVATLPKGAK